MFIVFKAHTSIISIYLLVFFYFLQDSAASAEIPKGAGKRPGRPSINITAKQKQDRSRQSARECRSRKNVRYQYLEQLVRVKEKSIFRLRDELEMVCIYLIL